MTPESPPPRPSVASNPRPFSGGAEGGVPFEGRIGVKQHETPDERRHRRLRWSVELLARGIGELTGGKALSQAPILALVNLGVAAGLSEDAAIEEAVRGLVLGARMRRLELYHGGRP